MNLMQIEKLDDSNYVTWSIHMKSILVHSDLWSITCRREVKPETATLAEAAVFDSKDEKALASILLCVKSSQLNHLKNCTTAAQAWDKLKEIHQPKGPARKIMLFKKLLHLKMAEGSKIADHINEFMDTVESLIEVEMTLADEILVILLLSSLPRSFENFVVAIETRDSLPLLNSLKIKLLEEGERQKENENTASSSSTSETLMQTKTDKKYHKKNNNYRFEKAKAKNNEQNNRKCYNCGQPGHFAAKCKQQRKETNACFMTQLLSLNNNKGARADIWCVDSGATSHFCCMRELFTSYEDYEEKIVLPNNTCAKAIGRGDVKICGTNVTLKNVLHVEEIPNNFISVSKATSAGMSVIFKDDCVQIINKDNDCILRAFENKGLFVFENKKECNNKCNSITNVNEQAIKWHNRFGHVNFNCLKDMSNKNTVRGLKLKSMPNSIECVTCAKSKICEKPFQVSQNRSNELLKIIHSDVCGPVRRNSFGGARYFVTFIDDHSRYITVYYLKSKDQVFEAFKNYKIEVEKQTGKTIKCLRSDNGREYLSKDFENFLHEHGIKRQLTVPYTPQQNGVAERANRTLVEMARAMLIHSGLSEHFWAEALKTAVYIRNRTTTKILGNITPFEVWNGYKPAVGHLKVFGAKAIALNKNNTRKFASKGSEYIMIGYSEETKGYKLYNPSTRKAIVARDVVFFENSFDNPNPDNNADVFTFYHNDNVQESTSSNDAEIQVQNENAVAEQPKNEEISEAVYTDEEGDVVESKVKFGPGRPKIVRDGNRGRPKKVFNTINTISNILIKTPENAEDALNGPYADEWLKSMQREYDSLIRNDTWELTDLPQGQLVIGCKWVFAVKRNKDGAIHKLKSRLVAKGCSQLYGVNYYETFSPVVRYANIRMVIALAVEHKIYLHQMDVSSAYLNGDLHDTVFMKQPKYFEDKNYPNKVLRLKKSLYGLKQSGREWNTKLNHVLKGLNFTPCISDPCIYTKEENGIYNIIVVYVDDLIIGSSSLPNLEKIKKLIAAEFEVTDGGKLSHFLGMEFEREGDLGGITVSQKQYILDTLDKFGMSQCKEAATPLEPGYQVNCTNESCKKVDQTRYQSAIGALMYLALSTRPDIMLSVTKLAQRNCDPHSEHEAAYKHIFKYLKKTADYKLHYKKTGKPIECYVDADWAGDATDRKSFSGYAFVAAGCVFAWSAKKQNMVSLSSTEAEYVAISAAATEVAYVRKLLSELKFPQNGPMTVYNDNQSAQCLVRNPIYHSRSKHIAIKYHHVRDMYSKGEVEIRYMPTDEMISDILTKNLCKLKHEKFSNCMGLH